MKSGLTAYERFFIYNSFAAEAPTKKLIAYLKANGKEVYLPRVEGKEMVAVSESGEYTVNGYGIEEPVGPPYFGAIDVCVLPFLAVDRQGNRLGYGGGYYDRFLKDRDCRKIAYGFACQIVERVPCERTDVRIDGILTEEGLIPVDKEINT